MTDEEGRECPYCGVVLNSNECFAQGCLKTPLLGAYPRT